ncbi:MAG: LptF/LptG family permease [Verrucomicrobiales bacterium]|nr:LptF/LptG family permease [Verrucomicrobiales bacterium]
MTRILDRYVARQIMISAVFAIMIILIILILGNVFKEILRELSKRPDLSLMFVFKFIGLVIPIALSLAIPFSFLTSILLTFGKLSADSELVSMRMAGLSMGRICLPVAFISLFFTVICAWINLSLTPWAKSEMEGMKDTLINKAKRDPMLLIQDEQVMNDFPGYLIYANKEGGELKNFQMVKNTGSLPEAIALSKTANLRVDLETDELIVEMEDASLMFKGGKGDFMESPLPVFTSFFPTGISLERFTSSESRLQPENLGLLPLINMTRDDTLEPRIRATLWTELSMRMAFSVSCITFALIGVPLGITAQRRETTAGFVFSLAIAVVYYVLLTMAQMKREEPELYPHLLVWIPNILFIGLGLYLFFKVSRK